MPVLRRWLIILFVAAIAFFFLTLTHGDGLQTLGFLMLWALIVALYPPVTVVLLAALGRRAAAARYADWLARHAPGIGRRRFSAMQAAHLYWLLGDRPAAGRNAYLGMMLAEPMLHQPRVRLIYATCLNVKGGVALNEGRYREALEAFSRPLRMGLEAPAHMPLFHANRAAALYGLGEFEEAVEAAQHALAIMPGIVAPQVRADATVVARHNGALALGELGRRAEALQETTAAVGETRAQPQHRALALAGQGWALWQARRAEEAEAAFAQAEQIMPPDALSLARSVFGMRGRMRLERGDIDGADADLHRAVAGDDVQPGALYGLAVLADRRGDGAQAAQWRRRLLHDVPESFWARRVQEEGGGVV